jgi:hypothetical protein
MLKLLALVLFIGLFAGILISLEVGYRIGRRSSKRIPERGFEGLGAMEACGPQILSHGATGAREYSWCRPPRIDLAQIM